MINTFGNVVGKSRTVIDKEVDYIAEDGLYHCGFCGAPKQKYIRCLDREWKVGIICDNCGDTTKQAQAAREKRIKELMLDCFGTSTAHNAEDDSAKTRQALFCKRYAETFNKNSKWLVIFGDVGTGKSYRAAQICKDLIAKAKKAKFTSLAEIERSLWDNDKAEVYKRLDRYDLLVLDDFGAERQTEFTKEIRYNVIDMRYNSEKPLIITTNIAKFDSDDISDKRIFSRIRERSVFLKVEGADRRLNVNNIDFSEGWETILEV